MIAAVILDHSETCVDLSSNDWYNSVCLVFKILVTVVPFSLFRDTKVLHLLDNLMKYTFGNSDTHEIVLEYLLKTHEVK